MKTSVSALTLQKSSSKLQLVSLSVSQKLRDAIFCLRQLAGTSGLTNGKLLKEGFDNTLNTNKRYFQEKCAVFSRLLQKLTSRVDGHGQTIRKSHLVLQFQFAFTPLARSTACAC